MKKSSFFENVEKNVQAKLDELAPFWRAFKEESDRAVAIVAACLLDDLLERIIRASYIQDSQVKSLFKDSNMLQPFSTKINIAYFSGLIPNVIYDDLKLICEIRNKFAHAVIADLKFTDKTIVQKIDKFTAGRKTISELSAPRTDFIFLVSRTVAILQVLEEMLSRMRPPHLVEVLHLDK